MTTGPEVSVVIPTRNRCAFLPSALRSALGQVGVDVEVIVVDDASEDGTPELLASIEDDRIRVIRHDEQRGMSAARNAAIDAARAPWVAFLDDDDLWAPDKLRRQLDAAYERGATWAYCGVLMVSPEGDVAEAQPPPDPETVLRELLTSTAVQAGNSTVMADAGRLKAVGAFEEGIANPWGLWIRLAVDGPAARVSEPLVAYRRHPATYITGNRARVLADARHIAATHRELARRHGLEFDLSGLERWVESERIRALRSLATSRAREGRRAGAARFQAEAFLRRRSITDLRALLRILAGERAVRAVQRLRGAEDWVPEPRESIPEWLRPYLEPVSARP